MDHTLSLGWMQGEAEQRSAAYRRLLLLNMILQVIIGIAAVVAPRWTAGLVGLADTAHTGWISAWGGMVLMVTALYVPGYRHPIRQRWPNLVGIAGRLCFVLLYLWLAVTVNWGFLIPAAFDLAFAAGLARLYYTLAISELMSRP